MTRGDKHVQCGADNFSWPGGSWPFSVGRAAGWDHLSTSWDDGITSMSWKRGPERTELSLSGRSAVDWRLY